MSSIVTTQRIGWAVKLRFANSGDFGFLYRDSSGLGSSLRSSTVFDSKEAAELASALELSGYSRDCSDCPPAQLLEVRWQEPTEVWVPVVDPQNYREKFAEADKESFGFGGGQSILERRVIVSGRWVEVPTPEPTAGPV